MSVPAPNLPARVRIHEVGARDGLQNEKATVPTEVKARPCTADAGLTTIEATSFVHPRWVPQLADAEQLFPLVSELPVYPPVLVPNDRGLDRALALGATRVAVFASATESFAKANLNRTLDESLSVFEPVVARAKNEGAHVRGYVSMCFGDPWEGPVPVHQVVRGVRGAAGHGLRRTQPRRHDRCRDPGSCPRTPLRAQRGGRADRRHRRALPRHLRPGTGQHPCGPAARGQHGRRLRRAGLGGCPFARSATGNLATEDLVWMLQGLGIDTGVDLGRLVATSLWMADRLGRPSPSRTVRALSHEDPESRKEQ
ncbi:Hydroxymethylglutaryl-CoA lyase OS=Streptomyces alboniger OX=132473 GN=CP975_12480 PE=3 SV=1 [Streptomyces alboniger]